MGFEIQSHFGWFELRFERFESLLRKARRFRPFWRTPGVFSTAELSRGSLLREASDAIAVRRVNSDAAFRTTFSRVWRFTLFAFASVIFTWLKYACASPILTQGRC